MCKDIQVRKEEELKSLRAQEAHICSTLGRPGNWAGVEISEADKAKVPSDPSMYDMYLSDIQS